MRLALLIAALAAASAFAQHTDSVTTRTYRVTGRALSVRDYEGTGNGHTHCGGAQDIKVDSDAGQIAFSGSSEAPEMSEWLLRQLDKSPGAKPSEIPEWHSTQKDDDVAVFSWLTRRARVSFQRF